MGFHFVLLGLHVETLIIITQMFYFVQSKLGRNGVLIYPSHPFAASYHYTSFLRPYNFGYWAIFNVLKFPVTQVPLGLSSSGLPLGVQVITPLPFLFM